MTTRITIAAARALIAIALTAFILACSGADSTDPPAPPAPTTTTEPQPPVPAERTPVPTRTLDPDEQWGWPTITPGPGHTTPTADEVRTLIAPTPEPSGEPGDTPGGEPRQQVPETLTPSGPTYKAPLSTTAPRPTHRPLPTLIARGMELWQRPTQAPPSGLSEIMPVQPDLILGQMDEEELSCVAVAAANIPGGPAGITDSTEVRPETVSALTNCLSPKTGVRLFLNPVLPPWGLSVRSSDCVRSRLGAADRGALANSAAGNTNPGLSVGAYMLAADCMDKAEYAEAALAPQLQGLDQTQVRCALARAGGADEITNRARSGDGPSIEEWHGHVEECRGG